MKLKEFAIEEDGKTPVDLSRLKTGFLPREDYLRIHQTSVTPCHDVYIAIKNEHGVEGLLLVRRKQDPAKGLLFPIGGRILRGVLINESLKSKAEEECGLQLSDIKYLGVARSLWQKDSFGHGKGCDTFGFNFFARGHGNLKLNNLHTSPAIITPKQYTQEFRSTLHPYVIKFMDKAMRCL